MAISAVAYLKSKTTDIEGHIHTGFIMGKSKLELCAAVLAVELVDLIVDEVDIDVHKVTFFTDIDFVISTYIHNTSRRFYVYVINRVAHIRKSTGPEQWHFVSTEHNPAVDRTRSVPAAMLKHIFWLKGPVFLARETCAQPETFVLIDPDSDKDVRPQSIHK